MANGLLEFLAQTFNNNLDLMVNVLIIALAKVLFCMRELAPEGGDNGLETAIGALRSASAGLSFVPPADDAGAGAATDAANSPANDQQS